MSNLAFKKAYNYFFEVATSFDSLFSLGDYLKDFNNCASQNNIIKDLGIPITNNPEYCVLQNGLYARRHPEKAIFIDEEHLKLFGSHRPEALFDILAERVAFFHHFSLSGSVSKSVDKAKMFLNDIYSIQGRNWDISSEDIKDIPVEENIDTTHRRNKLAIIAFNSLRDKQVPSMLCRVRLHATKSYSIPTFRQPTSAEIDCFKPSAPLEILGNNECLLSNEVLANKFQNELAARLSEIELNRGAGAVHTGFEYLQYQTITISESPCPDEHGYYSYIVLIYLDK